MSAITSSAPVRIARRHWTEGPVVAAAVLVVMLIVYAFFASLFSSFTIQALSNDTAPLALAAIG